jgi:sulfate adenylyltransferase subunit 1
MGAVDSKPFLDTAAEKSLLRFITAGSVDDGKSTLIGRLLYDSKSILEDQYNAVASASLRRGRAGVDLSLLTDGLVAEREQGITIDVAYRYFATPRRKFIIADSPGHEQYTRNMVTAASTAQLAVILVDARKGVLTQTRRHTAIATLVGVRQLVFAVNKMDLIGYDETQYDRIVADLRTFLSSFRAIDAEFVPISAIDGDNVVDASESMPWYVGPTLLELLESAHGELDASDREFRFPVQGVIKPAGENLDASLHDFRGFTGRIESGSVRVGDIVTVQPSGLSSAIKEIYTYDGDLPEAQAPQSVALQLTDQIDISRGDLIVLSDAPATVTREFEATLCWLHESTLQPGRRYWLKHATRTVKAIVTELKDRLDINTGAHLPTPGEYGVNDIGTVRVKVQQPLAVDPYDAHRSTGSFILIDEATNNTVAAGMIRHVG